MAYSDIYLNKGTKIPTIVAILIVCFIGLFFIRVFTRTALPSKAEKKTVRRLEIANLAANETTIYWQTDQKTLGWVVYGNSKNGLNKLAYDERDVVQNKNKYFHHYVVLKSLEENQTYYFKLINDNKLEAGNNDLAFTFNTPKNSINLKSHDPAYGKIIESNGSDLENAIVLLHIGNANTLATLSKVTGEWLIPLNALYDKNTYQQITPAENEKATIEIVSENLSSQVTTNLTKISPLPQSIIIGTNFNFTSTNDVLSATSSRAVETTNKNIDILYPKENALIPGYHPIIKGVAMPNTEVLVTVHSDIVFSSRTTTDNKGIWSFDLPSSLSPGEHTITIKTVDKNGSPVTVERTFIIAKNGEQVLGVATAEPSITLIPTATPTIQVYFTPTQPLTPKPPVSGGGFSIPLAGAVSFIIVGIGLMLVF